MDRRAWAGILTLGAIWGASYLFIKIALREFDPVMVAFMRIVLAAAVLVPIARSRGMFAGIREHLGVVALLAAVQAAGPFLLIALGEQEISSSLAGILVSAAPIFTAILAIWVDHEERSTGWRLVGIGAGFAGVIVLLGIDLSGSSAALLGGLAVVLAALGYAVGSLIVKRRLVTAPPLGLAAAVMVASAILLAPAAVFTLPDHAPGLGPIAALTTLGVLGTGIAWAIFYDLLARVGPARALIVTYIAPAFAIVYGATLLDEKVTAATVGGMVLIVGGSWLAAGERAGPLAAGQAIRRSVDATR